jgi:HlyD family secretion protein
MRRRRTIAWTVAAVVLCAVMALVAAVRKGSAAPTEGGVPTGRAKRGELNLKVFARGELRATHSMTVTAPAIGGGNLKITRLAHTGGAVRTGDVIVEFDPSEQQYKLEQSRSELLQAEQEIIKAHADAAVQSAKDKVDLLKAHHDVRNAELDVQQNELVSLITAKKNDLALEQAKRVLAELEQDIKSHSETGQAAIFLAQEKRNKANLAMETASDNIKKMHLTAPMDGLISLQKNVSGSQILFSGMVLPEYHEGDQIEPGRPICEVVDSSEMQLIAKVSETERSNVKVGQTVDIQLDALPNFTLHGTVNGIGAIAAPRFWDNSSGGRFEATVQISSPDPRLRPGMTAQVQVIGEQKRNAVYVPSQALFLKDGKRIVYVKNGNNFDAREVSIESETESRVALSGLSEGTVVALADPTAARKAASSTDAGGGTL